MKEKRKKTKEGANYATYLLGQRISQGEFKDTALKCGTRSNAGIRGDLSVFPLQEAITVRRFGFFEKNGGQQVRLASGRNHNLIGLTTWVGVGNPQIFAMVSNT